MKRSRQAPGGFVKRQRVNPVGVLLNRLTRLPIEILNQILRMATNRPAIDYDDYKVRYFGDAAIDVTSWRGTERMRGYNYDRETQRQSLRNYKVNNWLSTWYTQIGTKIRLLSDDPNVYIH